MVKFLDILKNNIKFEILYFLYVLRIIYRDFVVYFLVLLVKMFKRGFKKIICNFLKNYLYFKIYI